MIYQIAADAVLIIHLGFVVLVLVGGFGWLWWRWAPLVHLPMAAWGAFVEVSGRVCPLTVWENALLRAADTAGYETSFVAHYLLSALYPQTLTRPTQFVLAAAVVVINVLVYAWVWRQRMQADAQ